jgi:hypothetical protein
MAWEEVPLPPVTTVAAAALSVLLAVAVVVAAAAAGEGVGTAVAAVLGVWNGMKSRDWGNWSRMCRTWDVSVQNIIVLAEVGGTMGEVMGGGTSRRGEGCSWQC